MRISASTTYAFWIGAVILLLGGCSGSQPSLAPSSSVQPAHRVVSYDGVLLPTAVVPKRMPSSQMEPKVKPETLDARTRRLLYISSFDVPQTNGSVVAYSMPHPPHLMKFVYETKQLSIPDGECSRTGKGAFWVTDSGTDDLYEFEYDGKRPIKTLSTSGVEPSGCSVDPASGDVAAAIISNGDVLIWPKGGGTPTTYSTPLSKTYFVGYDGSGDLFADGLNSAHAFALAELPKGGSSFEAVTLNQSIEFPGNIQWDGTYLAIGDQNANVVYQVSCSGTSCSKQGSTPLDDDKDCVQFWIRKGVIACPDAVNFTAVLWHYPAGGSPYARVSQLIEPLGSVIVTR